MSEPFIVTVQKEAVQVVNIPNESVPLSGWWLIREYCLNWKNKSYFNSLVLDDDGLSLICSPIFLETIVRLRIDNISISPQKWIPLIINVTGSASELPGVVSYLSKALSNEKLSIFHISTFESEVFLVQEQNLGHACHTLNNIGNMRLFSDLRPRLSSNDSLSPWQGTGNTTNNKEDASATVTAGFILRVLPRPVILARLNSDFSVSQCIDILMKLLLYDPRYSPMERFAASRGRLNGNISSSLPPLPAPVNSTTQENNASYMWGFWQCEDEITFLLEETDLSRFPEDSLIVSPQRWRVVKLCGRAIAFDETGIVSAMSELDSGSPCLNISTATTNCTLVPEELVERTLESLSKSLNCTAIYSEPDELSLALSTFSGV